MLARQGRRSDDYSNSSQSNGHSGYGDRSNNGHSGFGDRSSNGSSGFGGSAGGPLSPGMTQSNGPYLPGGNGGRYSNNNAGQSTQSQPQSQAPLNGGGNMYMRNGPSGASAGGGGSGFAPLDMQPGYPGPPGGMPSLPHMVNLNQMAAGTAPHPHQPLASLPSAGSINSLSSLTAGSGVTPGGMSQRMLGGLLDEMGVSGSGSGSGSAPAGSGAQPPHPLSQGISMHGMPSQGLTGSYMQQQGPPGGGMQHGPAMGQYSNQVPPTQVGKDDIIPTAIVIKNIPFAVQKETLLAVIVRKVCS